MHGGCTAVTQWTHRLADLLLLIALLEKLRQHPPCPLEMQAYVLGRVADVAAVQRHLHHLETQRAGKRECLRLWLWFAVPVASTTAAATAAARRAVLPLLVLVQALARSS